MPAVTPNNPFLIKGTDLPASEQRAAGVTSKGAVSESADPIMGANGELNAYSKKDSIQQVSAIMAAASRGQFTRSSNTNRMAKLNELAGEIRSAHNSHNAANFGVLGEEVTNEIRLTVARTGFIRRFLQERELQAGEETKVYLRKQDTLAYSLETDGTTPVVAIKQRELYSRENYINANILIEEKEIARLRADLLQEKLEDGFEMVMVQEDRQFLTLATASSSAVNVPVFFSSLTPAVFQSLKNQVESRGLPVNCAWLANNLWNDIVADPTFIGWFDPVTRHELVLTGELGSLLGVNLQTDAFIQAPQRVLSPGQIFFFSEPGTLGQLLIRKQLASEPVNHAVIGQASRGWFLTEIVAPVLANADRKSVV